MKILMYLTRWVANLAVAMRMAIGFGILLMFILLLGLIGVGGMHKLQGSVNNIVLQNNAKLGLAQTMNVALSEQEKGFLYLVLSTNSTEKEEVLTKMKFQSSQYEDSKNALVEMFTLSPPTELEKKIIAAILEHEKVVLPLLTEAVALASDKKTEAALKMLRDKIKTALRNWVVDLEELVSIEQRLNDAAATVSQTDYTQARMLTIVLALTALILGVFIAWYITRGVTRPLVEAVKVAEAVASGDLGSHIEVNSRDETGQLLQALKTMNEKLSSIVGDVRTTSDSVGSAAKQISAGNNDLSQRTQEQASALEETASSMEEMTSTTKQSADNAHQANQLAAGADHLPFRVI